MELISQQHTDISIAQGEQRDMLLLEDDARRIARDVDIAIRQAQGSTLRLFVITLPGCDVTNNISILQQGNDCATQLYILAAANAAQRVANITRIEHQALRGTSHEVAKYVLSGDSQATFRGMLKVLHGAQKTEAYQTNRNVLLTPTAAVNTQPQLEIYADDVKCSHGATTGQLDSDAMFYMQQRGLSRQTAQRMLLNAFMAEIIDRIPDNAIADAIRLKIADTL